MNTRPLARLRQHSRQFLILGTLATSLSSGPQLSAAEVISLAGPWRLSLANDKAELYKQEITDDQISLPGSTQSNGKGAAFKLPTDAIKAANEVPDFSNPLMSRWTPVQTSANVAWYQRDVEIPPSWAGHQIQLTLERTKVTRVWIDQVDCGTQDDIVTAQNYDLTSALTPGKHRLTIQVRLGSLPRHIGGHHLGGMQGNWNGIVGNMTLTARAKSHVALIRALPDVAGKSVKVHLTIAKPAGGSVTLEAKAWNTEKPHTVAPLTVPVTGPQMEVNYPLGNDAQLWDEFHPALYQLTVTMGQETTRTDFGLRELRRSGTTFTINGQTTFLRGTHDGAHFPLTGYASMNLEDWLKIFRTARSYGINHFRFHTWTPPEAAFAAADQVGMYLQPEMPSSAGAPFGDNPEHDAYCQRMGEEMLKKWANHPSFAMLALGNEMKIARPEHRQVMTEVITAFRKLDPTRLYAEGSNNAFGHPSLNPNDDYWTTMFVPNPNQPHSRIRASFSGGNGWLNVEPPSTLRDYSKELKLSPAPLIGHEVGQYTFFPDLNERQKYTGVYRLRNYDVIEERMRRKQVLEQNADFVRASGALAIMCYKAEIEAYLRTESFGGFQLLDLCDNQEQGTSLVGILDSFYESKGLITPEAWREFCSEVVPLVRFSKYVWTQGESFTGEALVAQYSPRSLPNVAATWKLTDTQNKTLAQGKLPPSDLTPGGVRSLGAISADLSQVTAPARLTLELTLPGTAYRNHYPLWVYPAKLETAAPAGLTQVRKLSDAKAALAQGQRVIYFPNPKEITNCSVRTGFETVFWNFCFANQPPTMGLLCDPKHPALAGFPTEFHSNWQWFNLVTGMRAIVLDSLPADYRPLVQMIDNITYCRKLGLIWEVKVGSGSLLVCSSDLPSMSDKPESRQLLASLQAYAVSPRFAPTTALSEAQLQAIFSQQLEVKGKARKDE